MSLDLHKVAGQIQEAASHLDGQAADRAHRLERALSVLSTAEPDALEEKRVLSRATFLIPGLAGSLAGRYPSPAPPSGYTALAVDGSHIDVDRHLPIQCFLINIGRVRIRYGSNPGAWLDSEPRLYADDDSLHVFDPEGSRSRPLEGPLLGAMRAVEELRALAALARQSDPEIPTIALVDGSLVLWGLAGQAHPDFVRKALIEDMFLPALDELREMARSRPLALAAYVSLPRGAEVVNALAPGPQPVPLRCGQLRHALPDAAPWAAPLRRRVRRHGQGPVWVIAGGEGAFGPVRQRVIDRGAVLRRTPGTLLLPERRRGAGACGDAGVGR